MKDRSSRLAVLIDAENAQAALLNELFAEIAKFGTASVKRAYGDFTNPSLSPWKAGILEHSIKADQQFNNTTRKNASDMALAIDAMDLLHSKRFDGFCIVSSDSDFTGLVRRLREEGVFVYGFGEEKTPRSLVTACDKFIHMENLRPRPKDGGKTDALQPQSRSKKIPLGILRDAVDSSADDSGWAHLGRVGQMLNNRLPDFDCRTYGHKTLMSLLEAVDEIHLERRGTKGGAKQVFARVKSE